MKIQYKISYLTNGTKVKITNELFKQIKQWETEKNDISTQFLDELKSQDNEWINSKRQYYRYTTPLQSLTEKEINKEKHKGADSRLMFTQALSRLNCCTSKQRKRFLLFYYYGYNYSQIAKIEGCSEFAVRKMVQNVEKRLLFEKSLL